MKKKAWFWDELWRGMRAKAGTVATWARFTKLTGRDSKDPLIQSSHFINFYMAKVTCLAVEVPGLVPTHLP